MLFLLIPARGKMKKFRSQWVQLSLSPWITYSLRKQFGVQPWVTTHDFCWVEKYKVERKTLKGNSLTLRSNLLCVVHPYDLPDGPLNSQIFGCGNVQQFLVTSLCSHSTFKSLLNCVMLGLHIKKAEDLQHGSCSVITLPNLGLVREIGPELHSILNISCSFWHSVRKRCRFKLYFDSSHNFWIDWFEEISTQSIFFNHHL